MMAFLHAMSAEITKPTVTEHELSGGLQKTGDSMTKNTISRNDLLLTNDFSEQFESTGVFGNTVREFVDVEPGAGDCVRIGWWCELDDDREYFCINKNDAERFAQAILIHSGARKVA